MASNPAFGAQLRAWRLARHLSQEGLAARAEISARHLNFVENGRANPSREVVLQLAAALDVPLRERNTLLTLAGFAAGYRSGSLDRDELAHLRRAVAHVLRQQEPYGAFVINARWDVLDANAGARRLMQQFPPSGEGGRAAAGNMLLSLLHPEGLRPYVVNWLEVASALMVRLQRDVAASPGDERSKLLATALAMPGVPASWRAPSLGLAVAPTLVVHLRNAQVDLQLFSMLTTIGTPLDVTADELLIETYFPADEATDRALRALADGEPSAAG
ncbi:MAG: helix-turn-helix transcriptional regulator [Kofleriaceae bacterium]